MNKLILKVGDPPDVPLRKIDLTRAAIAPGLGDFYVLVAHEGRQEVVLAHGDVEVLASILSRAKRLAVKGLTVASMTVFNRV